MASLKECVSKNCSKCYKDIDIEAKFCPYCGIDVLASLKNCIKCCKEIDSTAKFCPFCGVKNEPEIKKNCLNVLCSREIHLGAKFCPYCGKQNDPNTITFKELLNKVILTTDVIYDTADIYEKKLELNGIIDSYLKGENQIFDYVQNKCGYLSRFSFDFAFSSIDNMFSSMSCMGVKNSLLTLCKINHTVRIKGIAREKFHSVLIGLIENKIRQPRCGYDLIGTTNIELSKFHKLIISTEIKNLAEIIERPILVTFNHLSKVYFDECEKKLIEEKIFDENKIKNSIAEQIEKLSKYSEAQIILDNMLKHITFPIFYSMKSKEIFRLNELREKIKSYHIKYEFKEQDHCEKFQLNHIEVFILGDVIEDMLYLSDIVKRKDNIKSKMKSLK